MIHDHADGAAAMNRATEIVPDAVAPIVNARKDSAPNQQGRVTIVTVTTARK